MISPVMLTVRLTPQSYKTLRAIARASDCTAEHFLRQAAVYYVRAVAQGETTPQPTTLKAPEPPPKLPEPKKKKGKHKPTMREFMVGAGQRARERNIRLGFMDP